MCVHLCFGSFLCRSFTIKGDTGTQIVSDVPSAIRTWPRSLSPPRMTGSCVGRAAHVRMPLAAMAATSPYWQV